MCVLLAFALVRSIAEGDRHVTEREEIAREEEHLRTVSAWLQDTSANATVPGVADWPAPTSDRAKRMWVMSRVLVDRPVWEREVMARHGVRDDRPPAAWWTPRYMADARAHPEVGTYLEGLVAAIAEIEKTSAAWMEAHTAALARESGLPAGEIREIFPHEFRGAASDVAREADAMLQIHRYLVRIDPRVHYAGGKRFRYDREDDFRRVDELIAKLNAAARYTKQARDRRLDQEIAALNRWIQ